MSRTLIIFLKKINDPLLFWKKMSMTPTIFWKDINDPDPGNWTCVHLHMFEIGNFDLILELESIRETCLISSSFPIVLWTKPIFLRKGKKERKRKKDRNKKRKIERKKERMHSFLSTFHEIISYIFFSRN